jgi:hypothetical protein
VKEAVMHYHIVFLCESSEPMAMLAADAGEVRRELEPMFGEVALVARTTLAGLLRAGWTEESIHRSGMPLVEVEDGDAISDVA